MNVMRQTMARIGGTRAAWLVLAGLLAGLGGCAGGAASAPRQSWALSYRTDEPRTAQVAEDCETCVPPTQVQDLEF